MLLAAHIVSLVQVSLPSKLKDGDPNGPKDIPFTESPVARDSMPFFFENKFMSSNAEARSRRAY